MKKWGILLFCTSIGSLYGQSLKFIELQLLDEQIITAPMANVYDGPKHPGANLSYSVVKKDRKYYRFSQTFQLGYFYHEDVNQVIFLAWKPKYSMLIFDLFNCHLIPGLAYGHSFPTQPIYISKGDTYENGRTIGRPHVIPSLGLGFGINLDRVGIPVDIFIRQEYSVVFPNMRRLPISLHSLIGVGIGFSLNSNQVSHE